MRRILALGTAVTLAIAGCGGEETPVPDVVGERLDVAMVEVEDAGYTPEEVGGGAFGILDESNWVVCETRPAAGATDADTVRLIVERSCDEAPSEDAPAAATAASSGDDASTFRDPVAADTPARPSATPRERTRRVTVPNVVGMNHQAAQNRMQAVGLYRLREVDASGLDRLLLYDRNWTVVDQRPAPGQRVKDDKVVILAAVKEGE